MKKIYTSALAIVMGAIAIQAQTNVTLKVDDSANKDKTAIKFKGQFNSWTDVQAYDDGTNGDAVAGDNIWSLEIQNIADGTYEWGATDQNDAWLTPDVPNYTFTIASGNVTGKTEIVIAASKPKHKVKFTVVDASEVESMIKLRGSMFGWDGGREMYDDGTNGDDVANDHTFTLEADVEEGTWQWGIENPCGWKLEGSNKEFTVAVGGAVSGDVSYTIPAITGSAYNVTFRVDMSSQIVSSSGVYVSGDFMSKVDGKTLCNWSKDTLMLETQGNDIYTITVPVYAGSYKWKFFNGDCGDDGCQENADFKAGGCGSDNGLGGFNRDVDLSNLSGDTILPIYVYNSCDITPETNSINAIRNLNFRIYPNPAAQYVNVELENGKVGTAILTDISGRMMGQVELNNGFGTINTAELSRGIYWISIYGQGFKSTHKLFVE